MFAACHATAAHAPWCRNLNGRLMAVLALSVNASVSWERRALPSIHLVPISDATVAVRATPGFLVLRIFAALRINWITCKGWVAALSEPAACVV